MRNKPEKSVTGHDNVDLEPYFLAKMTEKFLNEGKTIHSSEASTVWAVTEFCQLNGYAYSVKRVNNVDGRIKAFSVVNTKMNINLNLPKGWTADTVEEWSPVSTKRVNPTKKVKKQSMIY